MTAYVWTDRRVREALDLDVERADPEIGYSGVSTDSRSVEEGELFVALVGDRYDGHDFVADAAAGGAAGVVASRPVAGSEKLRLYPVDDTLVALGRLARHRRRALDATVVGVTGSSGKTTTKELIQGALEDTYRVHATARNLNNRIGLPLTILDAPDETEVLVLEMGTNEPGEIEALTGIAEPTHGVVTTVSETHLEKLGSLEGVLDEKLDLLRGLGSQGVGIVSDEPPLLARSAHELEPRIRVAGWSEEADETLRPEEPEADTRGCFHFRWREQTVALRIPGRHAVLDALLALTLAEELDVEPEAAVRGVGRVEPPSMRGEIRSLGSLTLVLDCYNANPQSVRAALDLLATYPELGPRVAVLGTMLELGERSRPLHREVLEDALSRPLDLVVALGGFAEPARSLASRRTGDEGPRLLAVDEVDEVYPVLLPELSGGEIVLLKASRGVELERLVPLLEWDFSEQQEETEAEAFSDEESPEEESSEEREES